MTVSGDNVYVNAVTMVKDEADIVARTVSHMCEQASFVLVADNGSTDGTWEILRSLSDQLANLTVVRDDDPAYFQSRKVTALAHQMMNHAAWIIPFDADELWETTTGERIRDALREIPPTVLVAEAALYDHVATAADPDEPDPVARIGWRRWEALGLPKVACRAIEGLTIHQGNHSASFPQPSPYPVVTGLLRVRHFPYRSPEQFVRKAVNGGAAYAATDLDPGIGAHWRMYAAMIAEHGEQAGEAWFREHFFSEDPESDPTLIYDPAPS